MKREKKTNNQKRIDEINELQQTMLDELKRVEPDLKPESITLKKALYQISTKEKLNRAVKYYKLCKDITYLQNDAKTRIRGEAGEGRAYASLKTLFDDKDIRIINNLELQLEDECCEIDDVVITRNGLFIIEVKNYGKDKFLREDGVLEGIKRNEMFEYYDLGARMNMKEYVLSKVLHDALLKKGFYINVPIYKVLVNANSRCHMVSEYDAVKVCSLATLPEYIRKTSNYGVRLTNNQINLIEKTLIEEEKFFPEEEWTEKESICEEFSEFIRAVEDLEYRKEYMKKKLMPKWMFKICKILGIKVHLEAA